MGPVLVDWRALNLAQASRSGLTFLGEDGAPIERPFSLSVVAWPAELEEGE
jgi:hypothetical protein